MYKYILCVILFFVVLNFILYIKKQERKIKSYEDIIDNMGKKNDELNNKIAEVNDTIEQYKYFATSLDIFKYDKAIKIIKNNQGHLYMVMESFYNGINRKNLEFYLSGERHKGICNCPRILTTVKNDCIWIEDLFAIDENCGNGSLLLECLFDKAKDLKIDTIKGELSPVDIKNFDKLEYFYKKNGFDVSFNEEHTGGLIERKKYVEGQIR